jgi:glycosyltransferase involved in cell wall biosynthesis
MNSLIPKISVVMAVYNGEKYLKEAIESILSQTFSDFEFVIINDGSTDNSENIVRSFNDERIKYFLKEHSGLVDSLNFGLKKARSEFIARFDADDVSLSNRLETQFNFLVQNSERVLVGACAFKINELGENTGEFVYPPISWKEIKRYSLRHNPFIHPTVMFRKDVIEKVGNYRNFKNAEDYELWTRVIYKYPCANIPEKLLKYRIHSEQVTKKGKFKMRLSGFKVRCLALFRFLFTF